MTRNVFIVGVSMTAFGKRLDDTVKSLTATAVRDVLDDAGVDGDDIQAAWFSNFAQLFMAR